MKTVSSYIFLALLCLQNLRMTVMSPNQNSLPGNGAFGNGFSQTNNVKREFTKAKSKPMPYKFGYDHENDDKARIFHRQESKDGVVTGSYGYMDPVGLFRQVDFIADENGYRAKIKTNEPGTANENPANVIMESEATPLNIGVGKGDQPSNSRDPILNIGKLLKTMADEGFEVEIKKISDNDRKKQLEINNQDFSTQDFVRGVDFSSKDSALDGFTQRYLQNQNSKSTQMQKNFLNQMRRQHAAVDNRNNGSPTGSNLANPMQRNPQLTNTQRYFDKIQNGNNIGTISSNNMDQNELFIRSQLSGNALVGRTNVNNNSPNSNEADMQVMKYDRRSNSLSKSRGLGQATEGMYGRFQDSSQVAAFGGKEMNKGNQQFQVGNSFGEFNQNSHGNGGSEFNLGNQNVNNRFRIKTEISNSLSKPRGQPTNGMYGRFQDSSQVAAIAGKETNRGNQQFQVGNRFSEFNRNSNGNGGSEFNLENQNVNNRFRMKAERSHSLSKPRGQPTNGMYGRFQDSSQVAAIGGKEMNKGNQQFQVGNSFGELNRNSHGNGRSEFNLGNQNVNSSFRIKTEMSNSLSRSRGQPINGMYGRFQDSSQVAAIGGKEIHTGNQQSQNGNSFGEFNRNSYGNSGSEFKLGNLNVNNRFHQLNTIQGPLSNSAGQEQFVTQYGSDQPQNDNTDGNTFSNKQQSRSGYAIFLKDPLSTTDTGSNAAKISKSRGFDLKRMIERARRNKLMLTNNHSQNSPKDSAAVEDLGSDVVNNDPWPSSPKSEIFTEGTNEKDVNENFERFEQSDQVGADFWEQDDYPDVQDR